MKERKIILIEDDPDHAELITDILCDVVIESDIVLIRDGWEALDFFQCDTQLQVSLIILDLNLPKVNGMDVLKQLKECHRYSAIPVVIMSTNSDKKTIDEAYGYGANGYIVKPSSYEEFIEKVETLKQYC